MLNRKIRKATILLVILAVSLSFLTIGVNAKGTPGKMRGDKMKYFKQQGYYIAEGNTRTEYKDYVITAESVQYYEKEERAIYTGNVVIIQGKNRISGQKMTANMKTDEFVIEGNVNIYYIRNSKNGKVEGELKQKDIVELTAGHVIYKEGKNDDDHLIATKSVVMKSDGDTIKADYLEYKGGEEIVLAKNNVEVLGDDNERIVCNEFTYRLEGDQEGFDALGGVQLEFEIDDEEESTTTDKTSMVGNTTKPTTPTQPGGTTTTTKPVGTTPVKPTTPPAKPAPTKPGGKN